LERERLIKFTQQKFHWRIYREQREEALNKYTRIFKRQKLVQILSVSIHVKQFMENIFFLYKE
jgi:hypothetical protein